MKTNTLSITLLLVISFSFQKLSAQTVEVHQGDVFKSKRLSYVNQILFKDNKEMLAIRTNRTLLGKRSDYVESFNNNMNFRSNHEISLPDKDLEIENYIYVDNQAYIFMSKYDKDKGINTLYGSKLNEKGRIDQNFIEIVNVEVDKKREMNFFDVTQSIDSTKFLITIVPKQRKEDKAKLSFLVLDHEMKEHDNIMVDFPFKREQFGMNDYHLDKDGNIHILGNVTIEETRKNKLFGSTVEREARIFSFYKDDDELVEYNLAFDNGNKDDTYLNQIRLGLDKLGRLQCTGFYSEKKGSFMKGVFNCTIDIDKKEAVNIDSQVFTDKFIEQFLTDRQIKRKKRRKAKNKDPRFDHLSNFSIRKMAYKEEGGFYILAEYYNYYVTTTTDANGNIKTTHHYIYGDIMAINVNEDNSVEWFTRIPKYQHSTNDGGRYSGIARAIDNNNSLHIIFNEHRKNAKTLVPQKRKNAVGKKTITVLVSIDEEGDATKTPLMPAKEGKTIVAPKAHFQNASNELILYATRGKKSRFINVIIKD